MLLGNPSAGYKLEGNNAENGNKFSFGQDIAVTNNAFIRIPDNISENQYVVFGDSDNKQERINNKEILADHTSWHFSDSRAQYYIGLVKETSSPTSRFTWLIISESPSIVNNMVLQADDNYLSVQSTNDLDTTISTSYDIEYGI